jgi:hypothetical protein
MIPAPFTVAYCHVNLFEFLNVIWTANYNAFFHFALEKGIRYLRPQSSLFSTKVCFDFPKLTSFPFQHFVGIGVLF